MLARVLFAQLAPVRVLLYASEDAVAFWKMQFGLQECGSSVVPGAHGMFDPCSCTLMSACLPR
jgi:hypothetical protein